MCFRTPCPWVILEKDRYAAAIVATSRKRF